MPFLFYQTEVALAKVKDTKEIWDPEDIPEDANLDDFDDPRTRPEYDIIYKQDVSSEDIYLGKDICCDLNPTEK